MVCLNKHEKDMTDYLLSSAEIKNTEELLFDKRNLYCARTWVVHQDRNDLFSHKDE